MILCINLKVMLFILDYIFIICTWFGESAVMFRQPTLVPVLPSSGNTWQCIFQECSKPEFLLVLREAVKIPLMQVDVCPCLHKWVCIFEALQSTFAACQFFSLSSLFLMKNARTEMFYLQKKSFCSCLAVPFKSLSSACISNWRFRKEVYAGETT